MYRQSPWNSMTAQSAPFERGDQIAAVRLYDGRRTIETDGPTAIGVLQITGIAGQMRDLQ